MTHAHEAFTQPQSSAAGLRAAALQQNPGIVQTGDMSRAFQGIASPLQRPQDVPAPSPPLVFLPAPAVKKFVGRATELAELETLTPAGLSIFSQAQAVHGLGGVGKSELALQYAHRHRGDFTLIWWITAESIDAVESGLAELTYQLLPDSQVFTTRREAARWAAGWLQSHPGWLLVLDNVESRTDIEPLLGQLPGGRIIITTRRDVGWEDITDACLRLEVLTPDAAVELLLAFSNHADRSAAAVLAGELGCLPLALSQAGAYLRQNRTNLDAYLKGLREDPAEVLQSVAAGKTAERAIARVWSVTLSQITAADDGVAVTLLNLMAWLGPDPIPRVILGGTDLPQNKLDKALGFLASYNIITLTSYSITIHRLVQAVLRSIAQSDESAEQNYSNAASILIRAAPKRPAVNPADWPLWASLEPHVYALAGNLHDSHESLDLLRLLVLVGQYRKGLGDYDSAIKSHETALLGYSRILGEDDRKTLAAHHTLAHLYESAGKAEKALSIHIEVLNQRRRLLGDDHAETLTARNGVVGAYWRADRPDEALVASRNLVTDSIRIFGEEDRKTLMHRQNLAMLVQQTGDVDQAILLFEEVLSVNMRVFGDKDSHTLRVRHNLAHAYDEGDRIADAIATHEEVLADYRLLYGDDHLETLTAHHCIAHSYQRFGQLENSVAKHEFVVAEHQRLLGKAHPTTLNLHGCLASAYLEAGRKDDAVVILEAAVEIAHQAFGDGSSRTARLAEQLRPLRKNP